MIRQILNKVFGFLPITRWEFGKWVKSLDGVLEAIEVADAQHGQIEKGIVDQLGKLVAGKSKNMKDEDLSNDVAFN